MKKEYSTPIVEKIAFNYRDQVVAASGGQGGGGDTGSGNDQVIETPRTTLGLGESTCRDAVNWTEFLWIIPTCVFS